MCFEHDGHLTPEVGESETGGPYPYEGHRDVGSSRVGGGERVGPVVMSEKMRQKRPIRVDEPEVLLHETNEPEATGDVEKKEDVGHGDGVVEREAARGLRDS